MTGQRHPGLARLAQVLAITTTGPHRRLPLDGRRHGPGGDRRTSAVAFAVLLPVGWIIEDVPLAMTLWLAISYGLRPRRGMAC